MTPIQKTMNSDYTLLGFGHGDDGDLSLDGEDD